MTRTEMIAAINAWEAILSNNNSMISYLGQGNSFIFDFPGYASGTSYIHAYPAIHNGDMYFLLIPANYDTSTYNLTFQNYVTVCQLVTRGTVPTSTAISSSGTQRIASGSALSRMADWDSDYTTWIPSQAATADGMFRAFAIPTDSFEVEDSQVNLALKPNGGSLPIADMIIVNKTSSTLYYDDYVKPVPPFDAVLPYSSFYLLSL